MPTTRREGRCGGPPCVVTERYRESCLRFLGSNLSLREVGSRGRVEGVRGVRDRGRYDLKRTRRTFLVTTIKGRV